MEILFIQAFLAHDYDKIITKAEIIGAMWMVVLIVMFLDLLFGIKKAVRLKQARTSIGFRKTVKKANEYATFLLIAFLIDFLLSIYFFIPFVTLGMSLFLVFIEAVSIWESLEKNDQKEYKEKAKDFFELIKNLKEEDQTKMLDIFKEKLEETKKQENEPQ